MTGARLELRLRMNPDHGYMPDRRYAIDIDFDQLKAFAPLPRTREIAWDIEAQEMARAQRERRKRLRQQLVEEIANAVDCMMAEEDTIDGYAPKVWPEPRPEDRQAQGATYAKAAILRGNPR